MLLATFILERLVAAATSTRVEQSFVATKNERTYPRNPKSPGKDRRASAAYSAGRPPGGRPWFLFRVNYFLFQAVYSR